MVLLTLAGWAAQTWLGVPSGVVIGLLAGFVLANLVPAKGACPVRRPPSDEPTP